MERVSREKKLGEEGRTRDTGVGSSIQGRGSKERDVLGLVSQSVSQKRDGMGLFSHHDYNVSDYL